MTDGSHASYGAKSSARQAFVQCTFPGSPYPFRRGKVRDIFDLGDRLLIVSTDRISAFDWVLPTAIPDKGRVLNLLSLFWFEYLAVPNHVLCSDVEQIPLPEGADRTQLAGRLMLVKKAEVVPFECVVRGYLDGSAWKEYRQTGNVCGLQLPAGLIQGQKLHEPIFTPATKATTGHDVNVSFAYMADRIGGELARQLRDKSIELYCRGAEYASQHGILIADTKFEWGLIDGQVILIDEVLTPDSSRFWPLDQYQPGGSQPSFDKQFVRDWLEQSGWDKQSPPPELPEAIVCGTRSRYIEAYERLTERPFLWK